MKLTNPFQQLIDEVKENIEIRVDLAKAKGTRKLTQVSSALTYYFLILLLVISVLFFTGLAFAFFLSEWLGSSALGFFLTGSIPLIAILLLIKYRVNVQNKFNNFFASILTENQKDEESN